MFHFAQLSPLDISKGDEGDNRRTMVAAGAGGEEPLESQSEKREMARTAVMTGAEIGTY